MLTSAREHYRRQQRISAAGLAAARRQRQAGNLARVVAVVTSAQRVAVEDAATSVPSMLDEQGVDPDMVGQVNPSALTGVASDGRRLDTLFRQAETDATFDLMVTTQLQDVARLGAGIAIAASRGASGYVRMLNPPSCSRCAVQAGKWFRWNTGFQRHPRCDCRHVPSGSEAAARAEGLVSDPNDYFRSLSKANQDRMFTKSGAEAIRDGADVGQVVNARRAAEGLLPAGGRYTLAEQQLLRGGNTARGALSRVDVYGRPVFITREGITVRGEFGRRMGELAKQGRYRATNVPRLMPESIYEIAEDRADAVRLLRRYGFIT